MSASGPVAPVASVALVTGGGTGIGRATALMLARRGHRVALVGRRGGPLEETARTIERSGGRAVALTADLREPEAVAALRDRVAAALGPVEVLVNNAGILLAKPFLELSIEEWDRTLDTNLRAAFLCCRTFLPDMLDAGSGVIVNVSSTAGRTGMARFEAYCASKFGLLGLTEALAAEVRDQGVRVVAICPGPTDTPLTQSARDRGIRGAVRGLRTKVGLRRPAPKGMPAEVVAAAIADLIEGERRLAPGEHLVIDEHPTG